MEILLLLLLAHLIGDYLLQWRRLAENKERGDRGALLTHAFLYALAMDFLFLCAPWQRALPSWLILSLSHGLIDLLRVRAERKTAEPRARLISFCADQLLHLGFILLCYFLFLRGQWTVFLLRLSGALWFRPVFVCATLLLLIWNPAAILVRRVLALLPPPAESPEPPAEASRPSAAPQPAPKAPAKQSPARKRDFRSGELIGKLERIIVAALALCGAASAIGFVLTAKSVACFKQMDDRNYAERYLVGTLLSVCFALAAALLAKALL